MKLTFPGNPVNVSVALPASKSISNRLLILKEIHQHAFEITNLSDSEDTLLLIKAIKEINDGNNSMIDVHHAGTNMRFLTALLSQRKGGWILTGSDRMKQRPVGILVEALRSLGADVQYLEKEGFPPLRIQGRELKGNTVEIDGSVSSQFISALMMIASGFKNGLTIHLKNEIVSESYIGMTAEVIKVAGCAVNITGNTIRISGDRLYSKPFTIQVEADWSSASYWYSICALRKNSVIHLKGLKENSLQGDSALQEIYNVLGVDTEFNSEGVTLRNTPITCESFDYNFVNCPDIAQTVAVTCFALNISARLTGLSTLKYKETDRLSALKTELEKFGALIEKSSDTITIRKSDITQTRIKGIKVNTYNDHRMAMSFAPLAILSGEIEINEPTVVKKSYPGFWMDLQCAGFICD